MDWLTPLKQEEARLTPSAVDRFAEALADDGYKAPHGLPYRAVMKKGRFA